MRFCYFLLVIHQHRLQVYEYSYLIISCVYKMKQGSENEKLTSKMLKLFITWKKDERKVYKLLDCKITLKNAWKWHGCMFEPCHISQLSSGLSYGIFLTNTLTSINYTTNRITLLNTLHLHPHNKIDSRKLELEIT